jgi:hypothetical protein
MFFFYAAKPVRLAIGWDNTLKKDLMAIADDIMKKPSTWLPICSVGPMSY